MTSEYYSWNAFILYGGCGALFRLDIFSTHLLSKHANGSIVLQNVFFCVSFREESYEFELRVSKWWQNSHLWANHPFK